MKFYYVEKLGFRIHSDMRNGDYRWLTVAHPEQPSFQLGLFKPESPTLDPASAQALREIVAKGAMPPLVLEVDDCRAAYERMRACAPAEWSSRRNRWSAMARWMPASAILRATGGR